MVHLLSPPPSPGSRRSANLTLDLSLQHQTKLKIGIIGAAGLVGTALCEAALDQGHAVVALDRPCTGKIQPRKGYEYRQLDALDYTALRLALKGCDALVHLGAVFNHHDDEGRILDDLFPQHEVHNINTAMSYNALCACVDLRINRVVLASSVNAIGLIYSKRPMFDYLPLDENHPQRPEDAYSLSKSICEIQAASIARRNPSMRIASLRFHAVTPTQYVNPRMLDEHGGAWKDLWGWVSLDATAEACLKGLLAPETTFPCGHEAFFIAAQTTCRGMNSLELLRTKFDPESEGIIIRGKVVGNKGLFDVSKAERMLGWKEQGFLWSEAGGFE